MWFYLYKVPRVGKFRDKKIEQRLPGAEGMSDFLMRTASVYDDKRLLEMDLDNSIQHCEST